ncbi:MAG: TonB-dependent receptor plug domain-containing protein [Cyanobacteria bacterium P01_C01_bin.120]
MKPSLLSLSLLTLLSVVGGQIAIANAALAQPQSEPEALDDPIEQNSAAWAIEAIEDSSEDSQTLPLPIPSGKALPTTPLRTSTSPLASAPLSQPATTVAEWIAQIEAAWVQITGVRVEATEAGLQVILETADGELPAPTTTVSGNALIAEIPNAVLALPEGDAFQQFEPAGGIALVQVTGLPGDRVQVAITGTDAAPAVEIDAAATALTLSVMPRVAQTGEGDEAIQIVVTGEEGSRYFEPNTATATRTDTPLRDIPQSIQVIPQAVLEDQQVFTLEGALRNASGVVSGEQTFNGQQFIVRGFGFTRILQDGFRLNDGRLFGFAELSNLESIEVLKGPASILAGSIQPGGVINLVTEQPLSEPFYNLEFQVGNRGSISPSIDVSGPLTDDGRLLYRLNALYRHEDSFRGFDTDLERFFIAPTIRWQISDRTDLTVSLEYTNDERPADVGLIAIGEGVADVPFDRVIGELDNVREQEILRVAYNFEHRFSDSWQFRNAFSYVRSNSESLSAIPAIVVDEQAGDILVGFSNLITPLEVFDLQTNIVGEFNTG